MMDGAQVVNPGSLAVGSYAIVDLDSLQVRLERLPEPGEANPRTIVAAVDGSSESAAALDLAARITRSLGARLILVHAFEPAEALLRAPAYNGSLQNRIARGEQLLAAAAAAVADLKPRRLLVEGPAADAIVRAAETHRAEMIVLGSGDDGRGESLGAVSRQVVQQAPCLALIAHRPAQPQAGARASAVTAKQ